MRSRVFSLLVGAALLAPATSSFADDEPETEPKPPQLVSVDYASIPTGTLPPLPAEADAPKAAPKARVTDLKIEPVADKASAKVKHIRKRLPKNKKASRPKPPRVVEIRPAAPSLGLLYVPRADSRSHDGDGTQRMQCGSGDDAQPLRWEKLTFAPDGSAHLRIDDVWFDSRSCSLWPGSSSVTTLKPIAWDGGKPWLYAVRSDSSVTFVMPRANDVNADTMVGFPVMVHGEFTRITMPIGRWGSGSMLAALSNRALDARSKPSASTPRVPHESEVPVEASLELVQTMAERYPTLLVRTRDVVESGRDFE